MVAEKFQIYSVKIATKYICESKNWIYSFLIFSRPQSKLSPRFLSWTRGRRNLPIPPDQHFLKICFSPAERGLGEEDYGAEKITKIKPRRVLVTSFDKFHHLCSIFVFGFCFVVPQFNFKHTEVWRSFNLNNNIFPKKCSVQEQFQLCPILFF